MELAWPSVRWNMKSFRMSPRLLMPEIIEATMSGTIIIFSALRKRSPSHFTVTMRSSKNHPHKPPATMPMRMPTRIMLLVRRLNSDMKSGAPSICLIFGR